MAFKPAAAAVGSSFILLFSCKGNMILHSYYKEPTGVSSPSADLVHTGSPRPPLRAHMPICAQGSYCAFRGHKLQPASGNASSKMKPHSGDGCGNDLLMPLLSKWRATLAPTLPAGLGKTQLQLHGWPILSLCLILPSWLISVTPRTIPQMSLGDSPS